MIKTIQDLKNVNKGYFTKEWKIFLNDIDYRLLTSITKEKFLVTHTFKFSDMFDGIKEASFVLKPISIDGEISTESIDFQTLKEVKDYLKSK